MTLSGKTKFWTTALFVLVTMNATLGIVTFRELHAISRLIAQDYEITLNARNVRDELSGYRASGLTAEITGDPWDRKNRDMFKANVRERLRSGLGAGLTDGYRTEFEQISARIEELFKMGEHQPPAPGGAARGSFFVSPEFRNLYGSITERMRSLVDRSSEMVGKERAYDEAFYRRFFWLNLTLSLFTILVVALRMRFIYQSIIYPIQALHKLVQNIRSGNLHARWQGQTEDEIGLIGATLNSTMEEIQQRRRERVEFIGSVVHDLKNPLSAISMNCELVARNRERLTPETAIKTISRIKSQTDRLRRLADDLLQATKDEHIAWEMQMSALDFQQLVRETLDLYRSSQPDRAFKFVAESEVTEIRGDRDRLGQVLINLISNAIKYSRPGSEVEVAIGALGRPDREGRGGAYLEVRDRGVGIPDERKMAIFKPFKRLESGKEMAEGAGLGLANVREIVRAHGGEITVSDREGGGSAFRVSLPPIAWNDRRTA